MPVSNLRLKPYYLCGRKYFAVRNVECFQTTKRPCTESAGSFSFNVKVLEFYNGREIGF